MLRIRVEGKANMGNKITSFQPKDLPQDIVYIGRVPYGEFGDNEVNWTAPMKAFFKKNRQWTTTVLLYLSNKRNPCIRELVARHNLTPKKILARLSQDRYADVRQACALNTATPQSALYKLCQDREQRVKLCAISNPSTPRNALKYLLLKIMNSSWVIESDKREIENALSRNPKTPKTLLLKSRIGLYPGQYRKALKDIKIALKKIRAMRRSFGY